MEQQKTNSKTQTNTQEEYKIKVNRLLLFAIFVIAAIIFLVGFDLTFTHSVFDTVESENIILLWIFKLAALFLGLVIIVNQIIYLIKPPVMLHVTKNNLSFATGMRYRQYTVANSLIKKVSKNKDKLEIIFKQDVSLPGNMATSAGISYMNYTLQLTRVYMNKTIFNSVDTIRQLIRKR